MNPINFIKEKQTETKQLLYYYGINGCFIRVQGDVSFIYVKRGEWYIVTKVQRERGFYISQLNCIACHINIIFLTTILVLTILLAESDTLGNPPLFDFIHHKDRT